VENQKERLISPSALYKLRPHLSLADMVWVHDSTTWPPRPTSWASSHSSAGPLRLVPWDPFSRVPQTPLLHTLRRAKRAGTSGLAELQLKERSFACRGSVLAERYSR
jgi:hypothetical protein